MEVEKVMLGVRWDVANTYVWFTTSTFLDTCRRNVQLFLNRCLLAVEKGKKCHLRQKRRKTTSIPWTCCLPRPRPLQDLLGVFVACSGNLVHLLLVEDFQILLRLSLQSSFCHCRIRVSHGFTVLKKDCRLPLTVWDVCFFFLQYKHIGIIKKIQN